MLESSHNYTISLDQFGINALYYPYGNTTELSASFGVVRSHDWTGAYVSGGGCFAVAKWCNVETSRGVFDWADIDSFVNTHYAAGRKVILTIDGTPSWAVASPLGAGCYRNKSGTLIPASSTRPDDLSDWGNWCSAVATRYGSKCHYELWNEPQFAGGTVGYWVSSADDMAAMMRVGYAAIKGVDSSLVVISPSITGDPNRVSQMLAASDGDVGTGAEHFDVLGFHLYDSPNSVASFAIQFELVNRVKAALAANGRSAAPIWNTEAGVLSGGLQSASKSKRDLYVKQFFALRMALGIPVNVFYAYDSGTMGFKLPANTGTTYDLTDAYSDFLADVLGKTLIRSEVWSRVGDSMFSVVLSFSDGTTLTI